MKLVSLQCTQCGAKLPPQQQSGTYTCSYCGTSFADPDAPKPKPPTPEPKDDPAPKPKPRPKRPEPAPPAPKDPSEKRSWFSLGSLLSTVATLVPLAYLFYMFSHWFGPIKNNVNSVRLGSPMRALWDRAGGPPQPVKIGGREAVLGRMRLSFDDQLHIVASESATGKPLWKTGPLGTYSDGYRNVYYAPTDQHVVVSDYRGTLHIYELLTGKELKQIPLRDRATNVCVVSPNSVAVAVLDRNHVTLDLTSMTLTEAPLPDGCENQRRRFRDGRDGRDGSNNSSRVKKPSLRGFDIRDAHVEGELAVVAAVKSPGTPVPYAIGFTPGSREVRWQEVLPTVDPLSVHASDHDALAGGRYLAMYGVGSAGWHLTALDAKQGSRLYDVALRPLFAVDHIESFVATTEYVYVNRTSSLEIFDAATGKLTGTVGNETYK